MLMYLCLYRREESERFGLHEEGLGFLLRSSSISQQRRLPNGHHTVQNAHPDPGPVDQRPSSDVACAVLRRVKVDRVSAPPFIHDAILGAHGEELKDRLIQLHEVNCVGGELFSFS